jgi:ABC-type branched-subunit amino acid transport system substrate-binding protein
MLVAGALVAAVLVPASAGATPKAAASGSIKVGMIIPATNSAGGLSLPQTKTAMEASVKAFNKRGGVNGQKLVLDLCDSKGDPNTEANCARQMVTDKVAATLDDFAVFNPSTTAKILADAGIPRIGINLNDLSEFSSPVSFPLSSAPLGYFIAQEVGLINAGHKKLALVTVQTPAAGAVTALIQPAAKGAGGEIVTTVLLPPGTTDYSQYVAAATKDGADAIMLAVDYPDASQFMTAMQQLNSKTPLGISASSFTLNNFKKYSAFTKTAVITDGSPNATSNPKQFPFITQYVKDMQAGGLSVGDLKGQSVSAWGSLLAFTTIMKGAPTVDAASTLAAVQAASNVDMQGVIPPWTPSAPSENAIFKAVSNPNIYLQSFNGKTITTKTPGIDVFAALNAG